MLSIAHLHVQYSTEASVFRMQEKKFIYLHLGGEDLIFFIFLFLIANTVSLKKKSLSVSFRSFK